MIHSWPRLHQVKKDPILAKWWVKSPFVVFVVTNHVHTLSLHVKPESKSKVTTYPLGLSWFLNPLELGWGRFWWVLGLKVWDQGLAIWAWLYRTYQLSFLNQSATEKGHGRRIFEWKMHSFHWCWNLISSPKPLFHLSTEEGNLFLKNCIFIIPLISTPLLYHS